MALAELDPSFSIQRATEVFDDESLEDLNPVTIDQRSGDAIDFLGPGVLAIEDLAVVRRRSSEQLLLINVRDFDTFAGHLRSKLGTSED